MKRTEKLAKISNDLSDGYIFVKLRFLIEAHEHNASSNDDLVLIKLDEMLDTFIALLNAVKK